MVRILRRSINPQKAEIIQLIKQILDDDYNRIKRVLEFVRHATNIEPINPRPGDFKPREVGKLEKHESKMHDAGQATVSSDEDSTFHDIDELPPKGLATACLKLKDTSALSEEELAKCEVIDLSKDTNANYLDVSQSQNSSKTEINNNGMFCSKGTCHD